MFSTKVLSYCYQSAWQRGRSLARLYQGIDFWRVLSGSRGEDLALRTWASVCTWTTLSEFAISTCLGISDGQGLGQRAFWGLGLAPTPLATPHTRGAGVSGLPSLPAWCGADSPPAGLVISMQGRYREESCLHTTALDVFF